MPPCFRRARPSVPLAACSTLKPSRLRPRLTSRARAASSSIYSSVGVAEVIGRTSWARRRYLHHGEEQTQLPDGVGETLVVHGLGDVDVAAQFVAALDLLGIVGGGQ